ncbi:MAG: GntR family transcriptional regulator [Syntrophus sp. (in: bacteria)]|nr:GntR family transcriptional regulator [Syntrophus sp. (in: bacteria)]
MNGKRSKTALLKGIKPVGKPRSMGDVAYNSLKDAIIKGTLVQGQKLIETQLSLQMKVSRVPVREAMKKLERDGLVEKTETRGFVVKNISKDEIGETFGIRALLESYAALLATEHIDDGLLKKLEDSIGAYREALGTGDTERLMQLNTQFHEIIYKAAGSQKLYDLINNFRDFIYRYRRPLLNCPDYAGLSLNDHEEMVAAMRERDQEKVEQLVKKHILRGKEIILREMEKGSMF